MQHQKDCTHYHQGRLLHSCTLPTDQMKQAHTIAEALTRRDIVGHHEGAHVGGVVGQHLGSQHRGLTSERG